MRNEVEPKDLLDDRHGVGAEIRALDHLSLGVETGARMGRHHGDDEARRLAFSSTIPTPAAAKPDLGDDQPQEASIEVTHRDRQRFVRTVGRVI